jgi:hypothetical protein
MCREPRGPDGQRHLRRPRGCPLDDGPDTAPSRRPSGTRRDSARGEQPVDQGAENGEGDDHDNACEATAQGTKKGPGEQDQPDGERRVQHVQAVRWPFTNRHHEEAAHRDDEKQRDDAGLKPFEREARVTPRHPEACRPADPDDDGDDDDPSEQTMDRAQGSSFSHDRSVYSPLTRLRT